MSRSSQELEAPTRQPVHQLSVCEAFHGLTQQERFYAHHMSRAAWHGTRIVLRQVSEESAPIFDLILEIHDALSGDWQSLAEMAKVDTREVESFLEFSSSFLSDIGNYSGRGDSKVTPKISSDCMDRIASISQRATELWHQVGDRLFSKPPFSLGFPSETTTSAYYPGVSFITKDEVSMISQVMEQHKIYPENTRLRKTEIDSAPVYDILQASVETDVEPKILSNSISDARVRLVRGDHAGELSLICEHLTEAAKFAANARQKTIISQYCKSFQKGDLDVYRDSLREWVADRAPRVENIFGFVEPYRDPQGVRAEWEALVAIPDAEETKMLTKLVQNSKTFIRKLPWAMDAIENDGQGPFEKEGFDPPDFASIHSKTQVSEHRAEVLMGAPALAYCSSIIFGGINLPNYNDIRQQCGFKNVIIANRMTAESQSPQKCPFVDEADGESFQKHQYHAFYMWVVVHELLGHGTGKMLMEESKDVHNFDINNPPINALTGQPISSWYKPGQSWTGQFEDLATTVDECRCELVGAYLMDDVDLLALFGFDENSAIRPDDLTYYFYILLAVFGLRGLASFNVESQRWGQAHRRAHFAILKCLLNETDGFIDINHDPTQDKLTVRVDRSKISQVGKPVLADMLLKLHMYRSTADVRACRTYYEDLSRVEEKHLEWRKTVINNAEPGWNYVHANTFVENGDVVLKEYEATAEGIIQSWADRNI